MKPKKQVYTPKWNILKLNYSGMLVATIFYGLSFAPSLLPRPWAYQAVISGLSAAFGYFVGTTISYLIRWAKPLDVHYKVRNSAWIALPIISLIVIGASLSLGIIWQNEIANLLSIEETSGIRVIGLVVVSALSFVLIVLSGRFVALSYKRVSIFISKYIPWRIGVLTTSLLIIVLIGYIASGGLFRGFTNLANNVYSNSNLQTPEGAVIPSSTFKSGNSESAIAWDSLGRQGKRFVSSGPSVEEISIFNDSDNTKQPIRIYSGLLSANTTTERSNLVIEELRRTDAFSRKVLIVATPTGTGWIEPESPDAIEYMFDGDTAFVSQQYSYLPSWISFLVNTEDAREAGRSLFDAVHREWRMLPEDSRPKLIVYGLSLGSFGAQSAFRSIDDISATTDGALFQGTPNNTELWHYVSSNRVYGSPEWQPKYINSDQVVFGSSNQDIITSSQRDTWQKPRILYMQHASDPVVWFSFDLMWSKPDWLNEPRGPDVSPATRWFPFVTFMHVAIDQFFGTAVPLGHGHNYADSIVASWAALSEPNEWSPQKTVDLQNLLTTD